LGISFIKKADRILVSDSIGRIESRELFAGETRVIKTGLRVRGRCIM
jgi:hypothetical protein